MKISQASRIPGWWQQLNPARRPSRKRKAVALTGPTIGATTSRRRARLARAEQAAAEPDDDLEATARVRAFLDRMIRPR
jgi:hypothetical protein